MTQYKRGASKEYEVIKRLKARKYKVVRSAGSHGLWDVCGVCPHHVLLVQVKWSKTGKGWKDENFRKFEKMMVPLDVIKEAWVFTKGQSIPRIISAHAVSKAKLS